MRTTHGLVVFGLALVMALTAATPAAAKKKKKGGDVPRTPREALVAAPIFADPFVQERGQKLLNEACAAMLGPEAICDLVVKDTDLAGFYFKPESGVMLTSIEMLDTLKEEELRAAFAWAIEYADSGLRDRAVKMQEERIEALEGLGALNPTVGVGSARSSGNLTVGVGVSLSPSVALAIVDGLAQAVEDKRLEKDLRKLDDEVADELEEAEFGRKGLIKLFKRARKEGDDYLIDRETGIGRVNEARLRNLKGSVQ